ncbi:kinase-like domain-containing protein [Sporodiniella umbellata]|nr:kinase-like domain-containing protein [Sporodiniella umbellata]
MSDFFLDNFNSSDTLQSPEDDHVEKLIEEFKDAYEEDPWPTKCLESITDETIEFEVQRSFKRRSLSNSSRYIKESHTTMDNVSSNSSDQHHCSTRSVRRRMDNDSSMSRSTSRLTYSPVASTPPSQYSLTTPSPHRYMYSNVTASPSFGTTSPFFSFEGNTAVETGTIERNVASLHISRDSLLQQQQQQQQQRSLSSSRDFDYNSYSDALGQPRRPSSSLPTETSIPVISRELEKITINDKEYTILKEIGKGSSGKVYQVMSHTKGEIYALKVIEVKRPEDFQNTVNEIGLLKSLNEEENIICLVDHHTTSSLIYMIMEYGEIDLATLIHNHSRKDWDINFVRYYWGQMLHAVNAIHIKSIVHSDLKPANFVLAKGRLKLIDFGIAKKYSDDTTSIHRDIQVGTINYMSPEALSDTNEGTDGAGSLIKLGSASDVWSLACILYQMVYGKTPFFHMTIAQKVANIPNPQYNINFPKQIMYGPSNISVDIPDSLISLLSRCLNRSPKLRPTILELLNHPFVNL